MLQDLIQDRQKKLENIKKAGINPFLDKGLRTHLIAQVLKDFDSLVEKEEKVSLCGRLKAIRGHGGLKFIDLEDESGKIQSVLRKNLLGLKKYQIFENFDIGDFLEINGVLFTTQKGEKTLAVSQFRMLSKSLRPLPEKWQGLKDIEKKYRKRYLEFVMDRTAREKFKKRAQIIDAIRDFLTNNGFLEVETPVLQTKASGALAKPFKTYHNALDMEVFLRIAPETYLKRLVVGGFEKVFEFARVFRNEGLDPSHLQDFTMLEFYQAYSNYQDLMQMTEEMFVYLLQNLFGKTVIEYQGKKFDFTPPYPRKSFQKLILQETGIDILKHKKVADLQKEIKAKKIKLEYDENIGLGNLIDLLYKKTVRPKLIQPVFLIGHPIDISPLARKNDQNPKIVDRFQLVVNTWEMVNAYSELVDPLDQRARFEEQSQAREKGDEEAHIMDDDYLLAMEYGMPPIAGWGMGIDRLTAFLTNQENLRDVVLFPLMRSKG